MYSGHVWAWVLSALAAYFLGAVNGAIIASRNFHKTDIRNHGSGNAGMTNALRTFGVKTTVIVTLIDVCKTALALLIGQLLVGDMTVIVCGTFVALGHAFPVYYGFKGGKCVLSAAVILLWMSWRVLLVAVAVFFIMSFVTKIVSAGSILACVSAPVATAVFMPGQTEYIVFVAVMASFVIFLHRGNIKRMIDKTEFTDPGGKGGGR